MVSEFSPFSSNSEAETNSDSETPGGGFEQSGTKLPDAQADKGFFAGDQAEAFLPTDDLPISDVNEIEAEDTAENFDQSQLVSAVNDQIKKNYSDYLPENAQLMDQNNVEFQSGSSFDDPATYGYYDWSESGKLVINEDAGGAMETLIHEGLHMVSDDGDEITPEGKFGHHLGLEEVELDPNTREIVGASNLALNEGITEMFTRQTATDMGVSDISIAYPSEVAVAQALSNLVGEDVVKDAYFNSKVNDLRAATDSIRGTGAFDNIRLLMDYGAPDAALAIVRKGIPVDEETK